MLKTDTIERRSYVGALLLLVACGCDLNEDQPPRVDPLAHGGAQGAGVDSNVSMPVGSRRVASSNSRGGTDSNDSASTDRKVANSKGLGAVQEGDQSALTVAFPWTPEVLGPSAWFVASSSDFQVLSGVAHWFDHRGPQLPHLEQSVGWAQPQLDVDGWNGTDPTLKFTGSQLMTRNGWTGSPTGTSAGFTLLAVMRSAAPQHAGIASWWSEFGDGVFVNVRATDGLTLLDFHKLDDGSIYQLHSGDQDLGTGRHVVAWRYSPGVHTFTLTVDGAHSVSSPQPPIGLISPMPLIVGAMSPLPTGFFQGDISELVFVGRDITDAEVEDFTEYARNTWSGLPATSGAGPCIKADGQPSPETIRCDDENPATIGDHCFEGACVGSAPRPGSTKELSPTSWYYASAPDVVISWNGVSTWYDRAPARQDLLNGYAARPTFVANGWNGNKPTLTFNGGSVLKRTNFIGTPTGRESAFSALAVLRSSVLDPNVPSVAGVAGWWSQNGSKVYIQTKTSGGATVLDLLRTDSWPNATHEFVGDIALGTTRHAVAWRYADGIMKLTVDGVTRTQTNTAIGDITPEVFLVGMAHIFGDLYRGDLSELAIIPRSITDGELARFNAYAEAEWGGLTLCTPDCVGKNTGDDNECGGVCGCDLSAPFEAPVPAFTGSMDADGLTFSADERTAYISGAGPGNRDIYVATRSSAEGTFGAPELVAEINTGGIERAPSLSPDGRLYFTKQPSSMFDIGRAVGTAPSFTGSEVVCNQPGAPGCPSTPISSSQQDEDPFWWGNDTLLFVSEIDNGGAHRDIWMATWTGTTFLTPTKLQGQDLQSSYEELRPVLSPDGLTLYFGSKRFGIGSDFDGDVWMARRTSTTASFGPSVNLAGLNSSGVEFPVTVSADGCTLYFASNEETGLGSGTNVRLYQTTRGTSTPLNVTLRLNILGQGSVVYGPFNCGPGNTGVCSASAAPDTTMGILASGPAQWTGSCTANGAGQPSTDGILTFSTNAVCTIKFPGGTPNGEGGICALPMDCQPGLSCVNNKCTGCVPGVCNAVCPCGPGAPCDEDADCESGLDCTNGTCGCSQGEPCDDGNVCTQTDVCDADVCVGGAPLPTDDMNSCTADACHPVTGVSHTPLPEGASCTLANGDSSVCDGTGTCQPRTLGDCIATGVRDATEECDDGPGDALDACSSTCRLTDQPVAPLERVAGVRRSRTLGYGRHPLAAGPNGTLIAYSELQASTSPLMGALFGVSGQPLSVFELGADADPSQYADASVAAIAPDRFVAAWNDLGGLSLDVAMRLVEASETPANGDVVVANSVRAGAQQDPDLVWTGSELIVAWSSEFVIQARRFDADLAPIGTEQQLGFSGERAGSVSLERFGGTWAAAWRVIDAGGELIRIHAGDANWSVGPFLPGAELERPALVELDASNLLVVFTEGTDPLETGTAAVSRLRGAVLNVNVPGVVDSVPLANLLEPYASDDTVAHYAPTLARVGSRLFLGWETETLSGSSFAAELWLQELGWSTNNGLVQEVERPIPVTAGREASQSAPAFAASSLLPQGALALAWEEHSESWPYGSRPDIVFGLRPVPFITLP